MAVYTSGVTIRSVCVFCGSSFGNRDEYRQMALLLGTELAARHVRLIYGGSRLGLMGVVADACLAAGGTVTGVIPQAMVDKEVAHTGLTELHVVNSMHQRKALMAEKSEAFIALPGGFGTLEEFFEVLTWTQLGLQKKACGVLNVLGYFDALVGMTDRAVDDGFLPAEHRKLLRVEIDPCRLLDSFEQFKPPVVNKWIGLTKEAL